MQLQVQNASSSATVPPARDLQRWVTSATKDDGRDAELCIRIVDEAEMIELNRQFRQKSGPTNVLAFPHEPIAQLQKQPLGDIVICASVVESEARQQGKSSTAHWAHMTVHGTLHLLGYDHVEDADAQLMEQLETTIMLALDFPAPYAEE